MFPCLPDVPYDRTSVRPAWPDLPAALRLELEQRLGHVTSVTANGAGFTPGFAAVLDFADGSSYFVKAMSLSNPLSSGYRAEARFAAALPQAVAAPQLRWSAELAGHIVLCFDAIEDARTPSLPWDPAHLRTTLDALASSSAVLASPTAELLGSTPQPFSGLIEACLTKWRDGTTQHPRAAELTELETRFDDYSRHQSGLIHGDLRLDNVAIDSAGRAWLCDWSCLGTGPAWFDLVSLLISAEASGIDPDPLFFAHPTAAGLPAEALDWALAAFLGYYLHSGAQPEVRTSPALRGHQRYYGRLTLRWLARRRGWDEPVLALPDRTW